MSEKSSVNEIVSGLSLSNILFVVFLVLKLTGTIDWSWWWVTAPLWGPLALVVLLILFAVACFGVVALVEHWSK